MVSAVIAVLFNVLLSCVLTCGAVSAGILYNCRKRGGYLAIVAIFVSYLVDNTIVFCTEMIPEFAELYDRLFLETPSIKTVVFIIRIASLLFLVNRAIPEFSLKAVAVLAAIHGTLLICVPVITNNDWMVYFYYFPSQFVIMCVCIWALGRFSRIRGNYQESEGRTLRNILLYFLVMTTLVLIEDTYVIFFVDVYSGPGLKIFNRNFCENIQFTGFAVMIIVLCVQHLKTISFSEEVPAEAVTEPVNRPDPVRQFCHVYGLTDREMEILRCVLNEMSQQEISDNLMIALGTVKTHTHNIYRKTETSNRNQIIVKYQNFLERL